MLLEEEIGQSSLSSASSSPSDQDSMQTEEEAKYRDEQIVKKRRVHENSDVNDYILRAKVAQRALLTASQEDVDRLIKAITYSVCTDSVADELARFCVEETQLGNIEGKRTKLQLKTRAALMDILQDKSVGVIEQDTVRNLTLIAKPVGIVGASTPATHPEATPVIKAINCIKGRNCIIISPNPRAKETNRRIVERMRTAVALCGFPKDVIIGVENPSRAKTTELFSKVDRVWATGGNAIVKYAYVSGTPAFGVGVGNAVVFVDQSADLDLAASSIARSKTFDLASSCSADNALLVHAAVYDDLVSRLQKEGGFLIESEVDKAALQGVIWKKNGSLNPEAVVRPAHELAQKAAIRIPPEKTFLMVKEHGVGEAFPFSGEKLSVVVAIYKVEDLTKAIDLTNQIHEYQGQGHSAGIYSTSEENIDRFGLETFTSRVMVNQPQSLSNGGSLANGMRQTLSLGCGSWGGSATTENLYWRHFVNVTYVSRPLSKPKQLPPDSVLFSDVADLFC